MSATNIAAAIGLFILIMWGAISLRAAQAAGDKLPGSKPSRTSPNINLGLGCGALIVIVIAYAIIKYS